jgi:hypothetical protein
VKKIYVALIFVLLFSACSSQAGKNDTGNSLQEPEKLEFTPAAEVTTPPETPALEKSTGALTARIFSAEEATVNHGQYTVQGQANQEVVVTVNDLIFTSPAEAVFSLPVELEEGPNLVEIVISDLEGNEVSFSLIITYQP